MNDKQRKRVIEKILGEIYSNLHCYHDFVLDCVKEVVEKWDDKDLLRWIGKEE